MRTKIFLLSISILVISCTSQNVSIKQENNLKIFDVGTIEIALLNKYKNYDKPVRNKILIDSIYNPNIELWTGYLGSEKDFSDWIDKKAYDQLQDWNEKSKQINSKYLAEKLKETSLKMKKITGFLPEGNWYIFFGPSWTDLGGLGKSTMLIDIANKHNNNSERIINLYAHELNHQIYSNTLKTNQNIVLNRIIDEGFATYVSYIYHNKKNSIAQELMFSQDEYKFCQANELELLKLLKNNYDKSDEKLSRQFANRNFKFKENYPGAIGYYLGFRIVEEFVKRNGKNSWKKIYTKQPTQVLEESEIIK